MKKAEKPVIRNGIIPEMKIWATIIRCLLGICALRTEKGSCSLSKRTTASLVRVIMLRVRKID